MNTHLVYDHAFVAGPWPVAVTQHFHLHSLPWAPRYDGAGSEAQLMLELKKGEKLLFLWTGEENILFHTFIYWFLNLI